MRIANKNASASAQPMRAVIAIEHGSIFERIVQICAKDNCSPGSTPRPEAIEKTKQITLSMSQERSSHITVLAALTSRPSFRSRHYPPCPQVLIQACDDECVAMLSLPLPPKK
eukprot:6015626-Karenia_brevis.AAC.1